MPQNRRVASGIVDNRVESSLWALVSDSNGERSRNCRSISHNVLKSESLSIIGIGSVCSGYSKLSQSSIKSHKGR